jgi:ribonuclease P protein component
MADPPVESAAEPRAEPVGGPGPDARLPPRLATLKRRPEFQRVRTGARWATPAFVLEGKRREAPAPALAPADAPRFGFTVSKQVGGAVERNRIKRRLKAAVRGILSDHTRRDFDYVLIARRPALDAGFAALVSDLIEALQRVHARRPRTRAGGDKGR